MSETELGYRKSTKTPRDALCIGSRGKLEPKDFPSYVQGARDIGNHIFDRNTILDALKSEQLIQDDLKTMKAFRKLKTNEYGYLVLSDRLLSKYRGN